MSDVAVVHVLQTRSQLPEDAFRLPLAHLSIRLAPHVALQRHRGNVLHHQVYRSLIINRVEQPYYVRVLHATQYLDLTLYVLQPRPFARTHLIVNLHSKALIGLLITA
jgi:hypothetical protein